jgi:hypothetical protein
MREPTSFSILVLNLFIGLIRGHRDLRPNSTQIKRLGYELFRIEPVFTAVGARMNPDVIAYSMKTNHTLLTEWTAMSKPDERKDQQVSRYLRITSRELVENAAVPPRAAVTSSTWLIVRPEASAAFTAMLRDREQDGCMLSTLANDRTEYRLEYASGTFRDEQLAAILTSAIATKRIPLGYVSLPTDDLSAPEWVDQVILQVVSFSVKQHAAFSGNDICESLIEVWESYGAEKRREIIRRANSIVDDFAKTKYGKGWLDRIKDSPLEWKFVTPTANDLSSLQSRARRFVAEKRGEPYQPTLTENAD